MHTYLYMGSVQVSSTNSSGHTALQYVSIVCLHETGTLDRKNIEGDIPPFQTAHDLMVEVFVDSILEH